MRTSINRFIVLLLVCGLMCGGSLKVQAASSSQKQTGEVTRIEWLKALTETFEMTVEEDNYPDNYYSDIDSSSEDYYDVMLATEFGLVDVEAGDSLKPDESATREFVAHTLNLCMGYQLENDTYSFSEAASVTYPQDIQIAIDKGWLELVDGNFLPEQGITGAEKNKMIDAAKGAVESTKIDSNYENTYQLTEGVIVIPNDIEVALTNDDEWTIYNCDMTLEVGDIIVVEVDGLPTARKVLSIQKKDGNIIVKIEDVETEEAFESLDVQGTVVADLAQAQATDDDIVLTYVVGGTKEKNYEDGIELQSLEEVKVQDKEVTAVIASKTIIPPENQISTFSIEADPGKEAITFKCKISDVSLDYKVSLLNRTAYVKVNSKVKFSCDIKLYDENFPGFKNPFDKIPIGVVGYFSPVLEGKTTGTFSLAISSKMTLGVQYDRGEVRGIYDFQKEAFTVEAKVECSLGIKVSAGLDLVFMQAELYGRSGASVSVKTTKYTDEPQKCTHVSANLYASYGAQAIFKIFGYKSSVVLEQPVWNEKNSPVRVSLHYENGQIVKECTRDSELETGAEKIKFYTPFYSQYTYSGVNSGIGPDGKLYTIFDYSVDSNNQATITGYHGKVAILNIPETIDGYKVVKINSNVFQNNQKLMIVNIPDTVNTIGNYAFANCMNLSQVSLSKTLNDIGSGAFYNCNTLTEIEIPKSLGKMVGVRSPGIFANCSNLKNINFETGTEWIAPGMFYGCNGLEEITIPNTVEVIGSSAFKDCRNLLYVVIPSSVTSINENTFNNCINLEEIIIPDTVTKIETGAFGNCSNLSHVELSKSLVEIGAAFYNCDALTEIEIPKSLSKLSYWKNGGAFAGCDNLRSVSFEEGTSRIVAKLFWNCTGLEEIEIPNTVQRIEESTFQNCSNLMRVTIPLSVTEIGKNAFDSCKNLEEIIIPDTVIKIESSAFSNCGKLKRVHLSKTLEEIGEGAFYNCDSLASINIPKSLNKVVRDYSAKGGPFGWCDNLNEIIFEEGTTKIIDRLFTDCIGLTEIEIPDTVCEIGNEAFEYCINLSRVKIPSSVYSIGGNAFSLCKSLEDINIPDSVVRILSSAFMDCTALKKITIPNSVVDMGYNIFKNCSSLSEVNLPDNCTEVKGSMFQNCSSLKEIRLPQSVRTIGVYAFNNCSSLKTIEFPDSLEGIGEHGFAGCQQLTEVVIPDSVMWIGIYGFQGCENLSQIELGKGLTKVDAYTFDQCSSLKIVTLPYYMESVETNAFSNCTELTELIVPRTTTSIAKTAFSNPEKMTIYGVAETYAETWATSVGANFVNQEMSAEMVKLQDTDIELTINNNYMLGWSVNPENFTDKMIWESSDESVADVSDRGVITAKGIGTATIRITVGNVSASCKVIVVQPVTSIYLNKSKVSMTAGETEQLTASIYPWDATDKAVTWSSSDETVATVDNSGKVTALKKGSVVITVTANDGSGVIEKCNVTVTSTIYHCATADELESSHNYENDCKDIWIYTLTGTNRLAITFDDRTYMENDVDYLYLYDANDEEIGKYTGGSLAGKTIVVDGDTIKIKMDSDSSGNAWGFKVIKAEEYCEHIYETTWSSDETYHWHTALCGHEAADRGEHISGDWIIDQEATEEATGSKHRECVVCGRILETQEIEQLINPAKELESRLETAVNNSLDAAADLTSENYGQATDEKKIQAVSDVLGQIAEDCREQNIAQLGLVPAENAITLVQQLTNVEERITELLSTTVTVKAKGEQPEYVLPEVANALLSVPAGEDATILVDFIEPKDIPDVNITNAISFTMELVSEENEKLELKAPVIVTMPVPAEIDPEREVVIYHYSDNSTEYEEMIPTKVDRETGMLMFVTGSFSTFTVVNRENIELYGNILSFGEENLPITLQVQDLENNVTTEKIVYGDSYSISNIQPGTYKISISKKNHVMRIYDITLEQDMELDMQIFLIGDVTGDGKLNVKDKRAVFKHLQGDSMLTDYMFLVGDVNGDGVINVKDKRLLYKHISGTGSLWE